MTQPDGDRSRLVVGVSGSSAPQLAVRFLELARELQSFETHVVMSEGARRSIELELRRDPDEVAALGDVVYDPRDLGAAISSGSFHTVGMVIIPCSMRTLAAVATGNSDNLVARAADVTLKERRRLVLVARETPLNLIHIENMRTVTLAGGTILPPVMAFYHQPESISDLLSQTCGKVIDQFGFANSTFRRWGEQSARSRSTESRGMVNARPAIQGGNDGHYQAGRG
ncbi:MAG: UbiX family flavin prenyltransferase [Mycobacterium sp.]